MNGARSPLNTLARSSSATRFFGLLAFGLIVLTGSAQSSHPDVMGATPYSDSGGGVTFRVWAPNATNVTVRGSFNGWGETQMSSEMTNGLWSVDVTGVSAGAQYKYFINGWKWKKDPRGRQVVHSVDNTVVYDPNAFNWMGDTRLSVDKHNLVIYEMHIGAFYDRPGGGSPGKFIDAINKLGHLQDLGVNAVELLPIWEFPGDYSWGYNPTDPYTVENYGYGGPNGLKDFVKAAHARGIHVFMDVVHNHYGQTTNNEDELALYNFEGGGGPGIYFYGGSNPGICCTPWGPRPDYSSQGVRSYIIDNFAMWMDEYHIDGFRWDAVGAMRRYDSGSGYPTIPDGDSLIQYINSTTIHNDRPGVISIGEDDTFGMDFDGEWDHGFASTLIDQAVQSNDANRDMNALWSEISGSSLFNVIFAETHDLVGDLNGPSNQRLPTRIDSADPDSYWARKRSILAAAVLMTTPGVPMLFMGQEMLATNQFSDSNPLDWSHTTAYPGIVNFFRDMTHLRRNLDGVSLGLTGPNVTQQHLNNSAKVLAYHRWGAGADDQVMVIMNWSATSFSNYTLNFPENGTWYVNLNSDWTAYGFDFSNVGGSVIQVAGNSGTVGIGPYSVLVLSRQAHPELDSDNDGLLNGWEQEHFGDPLIAVATDDDDLDDANNLNEQAADTDPKDDGSVLKIINIQRTGETVDLQWTGGQAVRQLVQHATAVGGPWNSLSTNPPPTLVTNSLSISNAASTGLYRIQIVP